MNELMLMKKDSGPKYEMPEVLGMGPTELIGGDPSAGFFGEALSTDLINGTNLASLLNVTQGTLINSETPWLKFVIDGKIIYTPKLPIRKAISWSHLYSRGIVYGTNDAGKFPLGTPVNQDVKIVVNGYRFIVRLMKGSEDDPTSQPDNTKTNNTTTNNEWDRLFIPITNNTWFNYSSTAIGTAVSGEGDAIWVQETLQSNNSYKVQRGGASLVGSFITRIGTDVNISRGWRPVLELVDRILLPPEGLHYITEYVGSPRLDDWNYTD